MFTYINSGAIEYFLKESIVSICLHQSEILLYSLFGKWFVKVIVHSNKLLLWWYSLSASIDILVRYLISYHAVKNYRILHDNFDKSFTRTIYVVKLYRASVINLWQEVISCE